MRKPPSLAAVEQARRASVRWVISLCDCTFVLLAFFILLFSMSSVHSDRWRDFASALSTALRPLTALDPRPLPRPAAQPVLIGNQRDVGYIAGLLGGLITREPALAGYTLERTDDGLIIRPTSILWADSGKIAPLGGAALNLLADRLRLVENTLVVRVRAPSDAESWTRAMARGLSLADGLKDAGVARAPAVMAGLTARSEETSVDLMLLPPLQGSP